MTAPDLSVSEPVTSIARDVLYPYPFPGPGAWPFVSLWCCLVALLPVCVSVTCLQISEALSLPVAGSCSWSLPRDSWGFICDLGSFVGFAIWLWGLVWQWGLSGIVVQGPDPIPTSRALNLSHHGGCGGACASRARPVARRVRPPRPGVTPGAV